YESDETLVKKQTYAYNAKGNKIEVAIYNSDGSVDSKAKLYYEYDSIGNWIKMTQKIEFLTSKLVSQEVTYRKITYYP
ncbi:MAG: hypothetical protein L0Y56_22140, partial [Nitrospira sp.]|nr:hypothetical protein [Nitrospira sp.]